MSNKPLKREVDKPNLEHSARTFRRGATMEISANQLAAVLLTESEDDYVMPDLDPKTMLSGRTGKTNGDAENNSKSQAKDG